MPPVERSVLKKVSRNKKQIERQLKRKEPLQASQILLYVLIGVLAFVSTLMGIACCMFEHLVEGVIIIAAVLVLVFVVFELVSMDRKANKRKRVRSVGTVCVEVKDVSLRWSDGLCDFGNVMLCQQGFIIDGDAAQGTYPWVALYQYTVPNKHVIELWFAEDDRCRITCNSDIKLMAAEKVLAEHVVRGDEA